MCLLLGTPEQTSQQTLSSLALILLIPDTNFYSFLLRGQPMRNCTVMDGLSATVPVASQLSAAGYQPLRCYCQLVIAVPPPHCSSWSPTSSPSSGG